MIKIKEVWECQKCYGHICTTVHPTYVVSTSVFEVGSMGQSRVKGIYECSPRNPELTKNSGTIADKM